MEGDETSRPMRNGFFIAVVLLFFDFLDPSTFCFVAASTL